MLRLDNSWEKSEGAGVGGLKGVGRRSENKPDLGGEKRKEAEGKVVLIFSSGATPHRR